MKKEMNITNKMFELNYFFEEGVMAQDDIKALEADLSIMCEAFSLFKDEQFKLLKDTMILNLNLCDDEQICSLNDEFRGKNKVTDVLSFPLQESIRGADFDSFGFEIELGDIFICKSVCESQSKEFSLTFNEELLHLCVHGFLHLCGYDHEISAEEEILMETFEKQIIETISALKRAV